MPLINRALFNTIAVCATFFYYGPMCVSNPAGYTRDACRNVPVPFYFDFDKSRKTPSDCVCYQMLQEMSENVDNTDLFRFSFQELLIYNKNETKWLYAEFEGVYIPTLVRTVDIFIRLPTQFYNFFTALLGDIYQLIINFPHKLLESLINIVTTIRQFIPNIPRMITDFFIWVYDCVYNWVDLVFSRLAQFLIHTYDFFVLIARSWYTLLCNLPNMLCNFLNMLWEIVLFLENVIRRTLFFDFISPLEFLVQFIYQIFKQFTN